MPVLGIILLLVLSLSFVDSKTRWKMIVAFCSPFLWLYGLLSGVSWYADTSSTYGDPTFLIYYIIGTVIVVAITIIVLVKIENKQAILFKEEQNRIRTQQEEEYAELKKNRRLQQEVDLRNSDLYEANRIKRDLNLIYKENKNKATA